MSRLFRKPEPSDPKRRLYAVQAADIAAGEGRKLTGYALKWNVPTPPAFDGSTIVLAKGSAILEPVVLALYHHDLRNVIGRTDNSTLALAVDDVGLKAEITLPDTTFGRDLFELVAKRYVPGMSFDMRHWVSTFDANRVETVTSFRLSEVTVTPAPVFPDSTIEVGGGELFAKSLRNRAILNAHRLNALKQ